MNKIAEINRLLSDRFDKSPIQIWPAVVKSVQGTTCTVDIAGTDLTDVPGVQLQADEDATEGVLLTPKVGSFVYISAIENSLDNLFVCCFSEVETVAVTVGKTILTVSKDEAGLSLGDNAVTVSDTAVTIQQQQAEITLSSGKVSIKNAGASLADLFNDLTTLLQKFQVTCAGPGAPSAPFPASVASAVQLATKAKTLLQ